VKTIAAVILAVMLVGCVEDKEKCVYLRTVRHDGHTWVLCSGGSGTTGVVHHPDCPCLKKGEK